MYEQVNRIFTLSALKGDAKVAAAWSKAIQVARPLEDGDLLEGRDAHAEGRGFSAGDGRDGRDGRDGDGDDEYGLIERH